MASRTSPPSTPAGTWTSTGTTAGTTSRREWVRPPTCDPPAGRLSAPCPDGRRRPGRAAGQLPGLACAAPGAHATAGLCRRARNDPAWTCGCPVASLLRAQGLLVRARRAAANYPCTSRLGGLRADVPEPPADTRGGQPPWERGCAWRAMISQVHQSAACLSTSSEGGGL